MVIFCAMSAFLNKLRLCGRNVKFLKNRIFWERSANTLKEFVTTVAVTHLTVNYIANNIGCIGECEGQSMVPTLNSGGVKEILWIDRRKIQHYKTGDIVILGSPLDHGEIYCKRLTGLPDDVVKNEDSGEDVVIKRGSCWVRGDNYPKSTDSNTFGQVPLNMLIGRATAVVWPPSRMRFLNRD